MTYAIAELTAPAPRQSGRTGVDIKLRVAAAADIAAAAADAVDRQARFPEEAFAALRDARLLSVMLPREFGGEDARLSEVVDICYRLGQSCSSTAMIFAMHQS